MEGPDAAVVEALRRGEEPAFVRLVTECNAGLLRLARGWVEDLPYWIAEELWETETDGDHVDGIDCLVFRRARLVREVTAWRDGGALRFAAACVVRAAEEVAAAPDPSDAALGFAGDAAECVRYGFVAAGAFAAAIAVARLHGSSFQTAAFRRERTWQAAELERVILAG